LLVLLLHTAAVTKDLGEQGLALGEQLPLPQSKTAPVSHTG